MASLASVFCNKYGIESEEYGYRIFVRYGLAYMGRKYSLNKFKYYYQKIVDRYGYDEEISSDKTPSDTKDFADCWYSIMKNKFPEIMLKEIFPHEFAHFVQFQVYGEEFWHIDDAHGEDWVKIMKSIDCVPKRFHQMELAKSFGQF